MSILRQSLEGRWMSLLALLGITSDAGAVIFRDLAQRYDAPERHYHNLVHVAAVLDALEHSSAGTAELLAAWFHDAVYDSRAKDNEERSAGLAAEVLGSLGLSETLCDEVKRLVLLTKNHQVADTDLAGQRLLDADLAVLGEEAARYDAYAQAIRKEYSWVPDEAYRQGRRAVLEGFLQRQRIFRTPAFAAKERVARANLRREMQHLETASPRRPLGGG